MWANKWEKIFMIWIASDIYTHIYIYLYIYTKCIEYINISIVLKASLYSQAASL